MPFYPNLPRALHSVLGVTLVGGAIALGYGQWQQSQLDTAQRHGSRASPWQGLPGCLTLQGGSDSLDRHWAVAAGMALSCRLSTLAAPFDLPTPSQTLVNALYPLVAPPADGRVTGGQSMEVGGTLMAKGQDVALTLRAHDNALANAVTACMTGQGEACDRASLQPLGAGYAEGARARMLALVDIDLATGGVNALSSNHSPCFARQMDKRYGADDSLKGASTSPDCTPRPPQYIRANHWRQDHTCGNGCKIVMNPITPKCQITVSRTSPNRARAPRACCAAVRGTTTLTTPARPSATGSRRRSATTSLGFVSPGCFHEEA